jgi:hypothetical protein
MKKLTNYFMYCLVLLLLAYAAADAQFSGKVCYVTPSTATTFPATSYSNADDHFVIDSLTAWGFTVDVAIGGNASATGSFNNTTTPTPSDAVLLSDYKLVIYSEFMSSGNGYRVRGLPVGGPYNTIDKPVVSLDNWFVRYSSVGFINSSTSSATTFINTTTNAVDFVSGAPATFLSGFEGATNVQISTLTTEASGNYLNYCMIPTITEQTIYPVATVTGTTDQLIAWGAEIGSALYNNAGVLQSTVTLKHRYAAVGVMGPAYQGLTTDGSNLIKNAIKWVLEAETGVEENETMPTDFVLNQNYPNPFNPTTKLQFTLEKDGFAALKVYNLLGQEIATLFEGNARAGYLYEREFNASGLTSGIYFVRLTSNSQSQVKKLMLMK